MESTLCDKATDQKVPSVNGKHAWKRYESIENSTNQKTLENFRVQAAIQSGGSGEWIASEKVHGANFCMETDGVNVEYASRTSKLGNGAGFMNVTTTMPTYHPMCLEAFKLAQLQFPSLTRLLIYGEYFGGYYPGQLAVKGARKVQIGVAYSPSNHFYAFDVSLNGQLYMDFDAGRALLLAAGFPLVAAPLHRGTLDEMLAIDVESFQTTIPALLGEPASEGFSIAEGLVIRPAKEMTCGHNRVILKKKARAFWENTNQPGQALKVAQQESKKETGDSSEELAIEAAKGYVNENRLLSVVSKDPSLVSEGQQHKLAGLLTKDALDDFEKEHSDSLQALGKGAGLVRKVLASHARLYVAENIVRIRADLS